MYPEWTVEDFTAKLKEELNKDKIPFFIVAMSDAEPLGVAALRECDVKGREDLCPWLGSLLIEKNHRKQGIGKLLIQRISQLAKDMGFAELHLCTPPPTESYYAHLNWQTIGKAQRLGQKVVIMRSSLT